jgi:hypothetical protein
MAGRALVLAAVVSAAAACAPVCREMAADREAFFARRATSSSPHATVFVPFALGDRLIAARLARVAPIGAPVALPGRVGSVLGSIRLAPRRVTLRPAPADRLGLRAEIDVVAAGETLISATLDFDARPEADVANGRLAVGLRAGDITSARPSLGPDAVERLARAIRARLPAVAAAVLPEAEVRALARSLTDFLGAELGAAIVRSGLLAPLGEITRVAVAIPIVPIARFELGSVGGAAGGLLVGITSTLPVGASVSTAVEGVGDPATVAVRISGDAVAEIGNWALATGRVPRRYDGAMHAKATGEFTPGLRWIAGPRPLKILAWRVTEPCLRARVGAEPRLALAGGELVAGIDDGVVEEVRGSLLVEAGAWIKEMGADAIRFSKRAIASARVSVAGVPIEGRVTRAFLLDGTFGVDVAVSSSSPP